MKRARGLVFVVLTVVLSAAGICETYSFTPALSKRKIKAVRKYDIMVTPNQPAIVEIPAMFSFAGATNEQVIESSSFTFSLPPDETSVVSHELGDTRKMYRLVWKKPAAGLIRITQDMDILMTARNKLCTQARLPYEESVRTKFARYLAKDEKGHINPTNPELEAVCAAILKKAPFAEDAVSGVCDWINENITFVSKTNYGSDKTLSTKQGNCMSMSYLACAMLRQMGIPCDEVSGKFVGSDSGHGYIEVYFPDAGWVFYDLSNWERGFKSLDCLMAVGWAYRVQNGVNKPFEWTEGFFFKEKDVLKYQEPRPNKTKAISAAPAAKEVMGVMVAHQPAPAKIPIRQEPLRNMILDANVLPPPVNEKFQASQDTVDKSQQPETTAKPVTGVNQK